MPDSGKPPTLADVAKLAGVSVPAASRALNGGVRGRQSGSPELRQRIEEAAERLGYSVNPAAQTIKGGRARTVAVVVAYIDDFGAAAMISGVMHAAERRDISVAVREARDDPQRELAVLAHLRGERHRAVIIATSRTTDVQREAAVREHLRVLEQQGTAVVVIGDNNLGFSSVTVDNRNAARRLAEGLIDNGARRFAIVSAPDTQVTAHERLTGFREAIAGRELTLGLTDIVHADFSRDGGYAAAGELLARIDEYDVIAAMSDAMAVGVIARLRESRRESGVTVTGFDHLSLIGDLLPEFSTVEVPLRNFGEAAMELALREDGDTSQHIALHATAYVRGVAVAIV